MSGANGNGAAARLRKRLWVGGATGFLGSHLVRALLEHGHEVIAVSRTGGEVHGVTVARVDVLDAETVAASAEGADGAFLVTGRVSRDSADAEELHRVNVVGGRQALRGLRSAGVPRVVVASTSGTVAIGTDPDRIFTEDDPPPLDIIGQLPYYRSKLYGEREALEACRDDFEVLTVNPSLLLGPGDLRESSTVDVRRFLEGSIPAIPQGGMAFVDVRDAAEGMRLAFLKGRPGERYLLNSKNLTVAAFLSRLSRMTGIDAPLLRLPRSRPLALGANRLFSRAVRAIGGEPPVDEGSVELATYFWYCSSAKAERELGFSARDPGETLRDTVHDLLARGAAYPRDRVSLGQRAEHALAAFTARLDR